MRRLMVVLALCGAGVPPAVAELPANLGTVETFNPNFQEKEWVEEKVSPPAYPKDADLIEFHVSERTQNKFLIDASTLGVGADGVVHYVMVIKTSGGATNVTFEGMRCKTTEYKLYATGRADGTWARSRTDSWRPIREKDVNRQHAALFQELFCPFGIPISSADDGRAALRLGKHPRAL
jgi:hypothetical protein